PPHIPFVARPRRDPPAATCARPRVARVTDHAAPSRARSPRAASAPALPSTPHVCRGATADLRVDRPRQLPSNPLVRGPAPRTPRRAGIAHTPPVPVLPNATAPRPTAQPRGPRTRSIQRPAASVGSGSPDSSPSPHLPYPTPETHPARSAREGKSGVFGIFC